MKKNTVFVIAEAGVNHNGQLKLAIDLVDIAVDAGADAVKFQTFKADKIATETAPKAGYQLETTNQCESHKEMLKRLELSSESHFELLDYCKQRKITFLSTAFDIESLEFLHQRLDLPLLKVSSGEITNGPLLLEFAKTKKNMILSTGMSSLADIEQALAVIAFGLIDGGIPSISAFKKAYLSYEGQCALKDKVSLLHCTSLYPTPVDQVNLKAMDTMKQAFGLPVGYSDHTSGIAISIAAVARGAQIIEKHFTLSRDLEGPDHKASLEPNELKSMISAVREVTASLGDGCKHPCLAELDTMLVARKSLYATRDLPYGEKITPDDIETLRPATGVSPMHYWSIVGSSATQDIKAGELIEF